VKLTTLTAKEVAVALEVERVLITDFADSFKTELERDSEGHITGRELAFCWLIAQRATGCDKRLLYHEGFVLKQNERMPHAWNTLNGKILDFSAPVLKDAKGADRFRVLARCYESKHVYTMGEVYDTLVQRGMMWNWMSDIAKKQNHD
jgi:hypothetical protein